MDITVHVYPAGGSPGGHGCHDPPPDVKALELLGLVKEVPDLGARGGAFQVEESPELVVCL